MIYQNVAKYLEAFYELKLSNDDLRHIKTIGRTQKIKIRFHFRQGREWSISHIIKTLLFFSSNINNHRSHLILNYVPVTLNHTLTLLLFDIGIRIDMGER